MEKQTRQTWMIRGALALIGLVWIGLGTAQAGLTIPPVGTDLKTISSSPVQVAIYTVVTPGGTPIVRNVTDTWLPEWSPTQTAQSVYVVFVDPNGAPIPVASITTTTLKLVDTAGFINTFGNPLADVPPKLTTSHYKGNCTNFGLATLTTADFTFSNAKKTIKTTTNTSLTGFLLTPSDCGGMAVIRATVGGAVYTFILPQDGTDTTAANGIPEVWEARYPPTTCTVKQGTLTVTVPVSVAIASDDKDCGPVNAIADATQPLPVGDGIANFDEYRGFIVSGQHIRTDPRQKDLFVHLVNPQCGTTSLLPALFPASNSPNFFTDVNTLISGTQVHTLGYTPGGTHTTTTEWVDNFVSFSPSTDVVLKNDGSLSDRRINLNAMYPVLDVVTNKTIQKGLRVIECVANDNLSGGIINTNLPLGFAGYGSANGPDNAKVFTQRILNVYTSSPNGLITKGGTRSLKFSTFTNGVWGPPVLVNGNGDAASTANKNFILSMVIQYITAMEVGHSIQLTPTVEGAGATSYGWHHAPFSGSTLDQTIVNSVTSTENIFYIPSVFNGGDLARFRINN